MKYDFDSYLLYEVTPAVAYTVRVRVEMKETVDGEKLGRAAKKAFRRFWYFSKTVSMGTDEAYKLKSTFVPIVVREEADRPVILGSEETNGLYFCITYRDKTIYFNFTHNFCGGSGALPWIQATLWQYLTDDGYAIDSEGILTSDNPIRPEETAVPDPGSFPQEEVIGQYTGGNSYVPIVDYLPYMTNPAKGGQYSTRSP